jgi:hypothetical protein
MSTFGSRPPRGRSIRAASLAVLAVGAGLAALALRGRAGAEGIPSSEPLFFSGELIENGVPVEGARPVSLILWSSATATDAASKRCETAVASAALVKGSFRVALNPTCVAQVRSTPDLWIETLVGGKSLGRRKIGAAPYAIEAEHASSATRAEEAVGALNARIAALEEKVAALTEGAGRTVQSGTVSAGMAIPGWPLLTGTGERAMKVPVRFQQAFSRPPTVTVALSMFDIIQGTNIRLQVDAQEITAEGFTAVIKTWADSQVYYTILSWFALPK